MQIHKSIDYIELTLGEKRANISQTYTMTYQK